jgi:F-type H+-transporting ATPase subunit b
MLDIHPGLMVFVLILFLALLVVLNRMLFQPLLKFMDDRERSIAKDLESAKGLSGNSEELNKEAQEVLAKAKAEATAIKQKAIEEEKALAESKIETKQKELEKAYEAFKAELEENKSKLKNELLSQMPLFKESLKAKFSRL